MSSYYCRRCDKEDVVSSHRCFLSPTFGGFNVKPMKSKLDMVKTVQGRLLKRLREDENFPYIPEDARLERLYHGFWQRAAGAWSWCLRSEESVLQLGSQWSMTKCLNAKTLTAYSYRHDWEVCPDDAPPITDTKGD